MQEIITCLKVGEVYEVADPVIGFTDFSTLKVVSIEDETVGVVEFPHGAERFHIPSDCLFRTLQEV